MSNVILACLLLPADKVMEFRELNRLPFQFLYSNTGNYQLGCFIPDTLFLPHF